MGEATSEQVDMIPATVHVLQHVRFKYACRQYDRHGESSKIITSPMPAQPIPGSNASSGTVAMVLTAKIRLRDAVMSPARLATAWRS